MAYVYSWRLNVPVWTPDSDFTETMNLLPHLMLERNGYEPDIAHDQHGGPRELLRVAFEIFDFDRAPPRWVVDDFEAEGRDFDVGEDGKISSLRVRGPNKKAYPRPTAREAFAVAMRIMEPKVDRQTYQGLEKAGSLLMEQLERFTKAVQPRLKPRPKDEEATTLRRPPPR